MKVFVSVLLVAAVTFCFFLLWAIACSALHFPDTAVWAGRIAIVGFAFAALCEIAQ